MTKLENAKTILESIGMPVPQQSELCCYVLLALSGIKRNDKWTSASSEWKRIHEMISYLKDYYNKEYAENSRETIRKMALHHFRNAALIEDNGKSTNSPLYSYRLTDEALLLIQSFKTRCWKEQLSHFSGKHERLVDKYASKKRMRKMPVTINGDALSFSPGSHNMLQKAIIEEFAPRFAPGCKCLYVGDTIKKDLIKDVDVLRRLGFDITLHDKMPDVILYKEDSDWLYFIEAVTSVGPMNAKRIKEIHELTKGVKSGRIFVTAFLDFRTFKKFSDDLAWETEVWIADMPEHMIHLNGDRFLGPR